MVTLLCYTVPLFFMIIIAEKPFFPLIILKNQKKYFILHCKAITT
jgi:hypothetical protein